MSFPPPPPPPPSGGPPPTAARPVSYPPVPISFPVVTPPAPSDDPDDEEEPVQSIPVNGAEEDEGYLSNEDSTIIHHHGNRMSFSSEAMENFVYPDPPPAENGHTHHQSSASINQLSQAVQQMHLTPDNNNTGNSSAAASASSSVLNTPSPPPARNPGAIPAVVQSNRSSFSVSPVGYAPDGTPIYAPIPAGLPPPNAAMASSHSANPPAAVSNRSPPPLPQQARKPSVSTPISKEEAATIDYYLRQAIAAKDHAALNDLVNRATEKRHESDLVVEARTLITSKANEQRESEISLLRMFMRQAIDARKSDAMREVIKKVETAANASTTHASAAHRRAFADLIEESNFALNDMEKENAQTVSAYLKQGVAARSREVLQIALGKAATVPHALLDGALLAQAKQVCEELDRHAMLKNFLQLAMKEKDLPALEETIKKAESGGLTENNCVELIEAKKLADDLHKGGNSGSASKKAEKERAKAAEKAEKAEREAKEKAEKEAAQREKHDKVKEKTSWFGSSKKDGASSSAPAVKLFGGPLSEAIRRNPGRSIPKVCEECVSFIKGHNGLNEAGLFRVAGNKEVIDALRVQYEDEFQRSASGNSKPSNIAFNDVHDASGLFKLYFRQLPEPLFTYEFYDRFIKIGNNKGDDRLTQLHAQVVQLPKENLALLTQLFGFLLEVSKNSGVNKMSPENLAIVFAPNLIRPKVETSHSMMTEMPSATSVIASCIADFQTVFEGL